jgi:phosphohistidine phosphatase
VQLYLLRHGIAEDDGPDGTDESRRLTDEGDEKLRSVLEVASNAGVEPTLILSSPLVRAHQTAKIAAETLGYEKKILFSDALKSEAHPDDLWQEVRTHQDERQLLLASHEPLMSQAMAFLLDCPNLKVDFKKGALVRIDFDRFGPTPQGVLKWMLTAKLAEL